MPVLISPARRGGTINVRYFMPHSCHKALVITGAIALASSCATDGTVAHRMTQLTDYGDINIEHPGGCLDIHLTNEGNEPSSIRASVIRTARKIFAGEVYIPE